MYGCPGFAFGTEAVASMNHLIDAIKRRQILRPRSKLMLLVGDKTLAVNLLPNGFIELDGQAQAVSVERRVEEAMAKFGAFLQERVS